MKKVIMLPSRKKALKGEIEISPFGIAITDSDDNLMGQSLYIIDTEAEIKEDDWLIDTFTETLYRAKVNGNPMKYIGVVIASIDKSLGLPLINKEFIELYVQKQGKIEEVDVEFMWKETVRRFLEKFGDYDTLLPKYDLAVVTPKESDDVKVAGDGGIAEQLAQKKYSNVIANASTPEVAKGFMQQRMGYYKGVIDGVQYQKKQSYSREEVIEIIYKSSYVLAYGDSTKHDADKWISQNLKK